MSDGRAKLVEAVSELERSITALEDDICGALARIDSSMRDHAKVVSDNTKAVENLANTMFEEFGKLLGALGHVGKATQDLDARVARIEREREEKARIGNGHVPS